MASRRITVEIIGDTSSIEKAFGRVGNKAESGFRRLGRAAKVASFALGAGLAAGVKIGFDELAESQQVAAQTAAAIKSTGGAAKVTAKQIEALALAQSKKTGIDDEAIQASENMLLTFTKIRNAGGKNNKIFDQATAAVNDMATRMNNGAIPSAEQLSTTAIRVGKALNDPVKGLTSLSRVGVQFTKKQKDQIKTLVASGKTMEAQKFILKELNTEFGGSAKAAGDTFAGQMAKARNALENFAGQAVEKALPSLTRFAHFIGGTVIPLFEKKLIPIFKADLLPVFKEVGGVIQETVRKIATVVRNHRKELVEIWKNLAAAIKAMWVVAGPIVKLAFQKVLPFVLGVTIDAIADFSKAIAGIVTTVRRTVSAVKDAFVGLKNALVGIFDLIVEKGRAFGKMLARVIAAPINAVIAAINAIKLPAVSVNTHIPGVGTIKTPAVDPIPNIKPIGAGRGPNGVTITGPVNVYGVQNVREMERALQKSAQRRSGTRRGPNAGNSFGLAGG